MSTVRRFLLLFDLALLILWIAFAVAVYDRLPDTIPTHFGPSGVADAYAARSVSSWFAMPAIGVCATLLVLGLAHHSSGRPSMYNVPGKDELLALPAAVQQPFVEQLALFMTVIGTSVLLLFIAIHYDAWRVAMGAQRGLSMVSWTAIGLNIACVIIALPLWLVHFKRNVSSARAQLVTRNKRAS